MATPADDDFDDEDAYPRTVRVPVGFDMLGHPTRWIETDPEVAGQWDPRCWRHHP